MLRWTVSWPVYIDFLRVACTVCAKNKPCCLNDYQPVALTKLVMKVFERLIKNNICSSIPDNIDPLQFAYRPNRSTEDAISKARLYHLSQLRKFRILHAILKMLYTGAIKSILTLIIVWSMKTVLRKALQRVVQLSECISGSALPSLHDIYKSDAKSGQPKSLKTPHTL